MACVCTDEFRAVLVQVVDASGEPVVGASTKTLRTRDGVEITPQFHDGQPGSYPLIDDSNHDAIDGPTMITFTANTATGTATLVGTASLDTCGCHIQYDGASAVTLTNL